MVTSVTTVTLGVSRRNFDDHGSFVPIYDHPMTHDQGWRSFAKMRQRVGVVPAMMVAASRGQARRADAPDPARGHRIGCGHPAGCATRSNSFPAGSASVVHRTPFSSQVRKHQARAEPDYPVGFGRQVGRDQVDVCAVLGLLALGDLVEHPARPAAFSSASPIAANSSVAPGSTGRPRTCDQKAASSWRWRSPG